MDSSWAQLLLLLLSAVFAWLLYRHVKASPEQYSKQNISKSLTTLGVLALGLILFIWALVLYIKN